MKKALLVGIFALLGALSASAATSLGQQAWSPDGWLYQMTASGWARTQTSRTFPIRGNNAVFDTHVNGQRHMRVEQRRNGWTHEFNRQTKARARYPAHNPSERHVLVDNTSTGGPRGWLTPAQQKAELERLVGALQARQPRPPQQPQQTQQSGGPRDGSFSDPRNIPGTPEHAALKNQLQGQIVAQQMGLSVPPPPKPAAIRRYPSDTGNPRTDPYLDNPGHRGRKY